ncbi:LysR family transcriptional regulator [uncultured Tolumonas sp.]|uniref:LysR family transcriptional regulator n=1 Tax=uncultured Tolumonas sp. TaxID=263765 RepID=UPI00292F98FA|nr:LysR family transcriptional regulator [uncultured Tolumonas sp.]
MIDVMKAMQAFVAVVDSGNFVSAAEMLDTSTAAISRQVSGLESHLGARLLNRTTRRISLTESGHEYYSRAQTILNDLAEAEAIVGQQAIQPKGVLRVSAPLSYGIHELARLLPDFMQRYPDLRLDIDLSDRVVDLANDGIDVAIRISQALTSQVVARKIMPIEMILCASPDYLAHKGTPKSPEEITEHETLNYSYLSTGDNWHFVDKNQTEVTVRTQSIVHASNGDLLTALGLSGKGIIVQPAFIVAKHIANGQLVPLLPDWHLGNFYLYVVYLSRKHLSAKVRAFIDYLAETAEQ